jgi:uncharacterized membrane protein
MRTLVVAFFVACAPPPLPMDDYPCPPEGTQLTYESFGEQFIGIHCNTCHGADEARRHGAPASYRFDTLADVQRHRARIFVRSAASNTSMPPGPYADPDSDERERLAEWLSCGAP